jgi:cytochrome P450
LGRLTCRTFLQYVFGIDDWDTNAQAQKAVDVFVAASWEWRKQIAVRGQADARIKQEALDALQALIRTHPKIYSLFEEDWNSSEYYSIILQPFVISPIINTGDIMIGLLRTLAVHEHASLEDALRRYHPFPILERYVHTDVVNAHGEVVVPKHTQVVMFTEDFNQFKHADLPHHATDSHDKHDHAGHGVFPWPIFGSGERMCAGQHLALPYLRTLRQQLVDTQRHCSDGSKMFQPEIHHRYSGRHLDNHAESWSEYAYFTWTILKATLEAKVDKNELFVPENGKCPFAAK